MDFTSNPNQVLSARPLAKFLARLGKRYLNVYFDYGQYRVVFSPPDAAARLTVVTVIPSGRKSRLLTRFVSHILRPGLSYENTMSSLQPRQRESIRFKAMVTFSGYFRKRTRHPDRKTFNCNIGRSFSRLSGEFTVWLTLRDLTNRMTNLRHTISSHPNPV